MTAVTDATALGNFRAVDATPGAADLVAALDEQASVPAIQRLRVAASELLEVRLGHRLVDVGCGAGDVVRALAGRVGPAGCVLGVDPSETMLTEARRRAATTRLPVEFRPGDITNLELDDASFDGTVCERVFQHLESPPTAMAELVRVTRPGGRIVVIDTDWGLHAIHGADPALTTTIVECWAANTASGLAGRQLPSLFADAGLPAPHIVAETMTSTDPRRPLSAPFTTMAAAAIETGAVDAGDADSWLQQLADAGRRGHFLWAVTMFAVASVRPTT
ncbi:MAG: methyltransferase domain-containing protein [Acidimicrobiales bacterium]